MLHSALLLKLAKLDIKGPFYDIIRSMNRENDLHVRIHDTLMGTFAPKLGVRQGDNLSPNLFKISINDLPNIFSERDDQVELDGIRISSLLYADDLTSLSTSKSGLQSCLNKLASYCENNCLSVNLKKTKVVVFCKNGRLSTDRFYYDNIEIENSTSYKYVVIIFSSSGTFSYCQTDLYKRALKAQFKLTKCFSNISPKLDTLLHLFEHIVEPIMLYGSEIWGTVNILSSKIKNADFELENLAETFLCGTLQIKFSKYISRMHKKLSNIAVLSEFGRYPLYINALVNTCKHRLLTSNSELLQSTLKESCAIANHKSLSWVACVEFLLKQIGISISEAYLPSFSSVVKRKLINRFKANLTKTLSKSSDTNQGKLRTYAYFKTIFQTEK